MNASQAQPSATAIKERDKLSIVVAAIFAFTLSIPVLYVGISAPLALLARSWAMSGPHVTSEQVLSAIAAAVLMTLLYFFIKGRKVAVAIFVVALVSIFAGDKTFGSVLALYGMPAVNFFLLGDYIRGFSQKSLGRRLLLFIAAVPLGWVWLVIVFIVRGPPATL